MNLVSTEWLNNNLSKVRIFDASWHMPNSKRNAEKVLNDVNKKLGGKVITKISKEKNYCKAEEYHQKYFQKKSLI